ncbi:MAG: glucose-1-phosphate adenylyltransferase, partial [candidate division NC10 bacterium]|nr:glucose-1-phosphate adenylyltransferase [candidate division NC10 bacterium]
MRPARILGIIMAGGKGERLHPLTRERSKPAVPFGGKYRIVDLVLSNFVNSGIFSLYLLVQYKSQSLIEHLQVGWRHGGLLRDHFISVVPPQMRVGEMWYRGTADAVAQNLHLIQDFNPDMVAIFGADHIYRMDLNQMLAFHAERGADVTVAALPVPLEEARSFGVIETDAEDRVLAFHEKPREPIPMPADPTRAYASMGNYIFTKEVLLECLLVRDKSVYAYNFLTHRLPGQRPYEEPNYWRDVGTIETYWQAHMDLLGARPRFDLNNPQWPILSSRYHGPPVKMLGAEVEDAILGEGCSITHGRVSHSVLGRGVRIDEGAVVEDSIVMDFTVVGKGARLRRVIADRFNVIP